MIPRYALLAFIGILVVACQAAQPERTCDEVSAHVLRDLMLQPGSPAEAHVKIADAYGLALDQVLMSSYIGGTVFQWSKDDIAYNMGMGGGHPASVGLSYQSRFPSLATVIACLGTPDYYRADYGRIGRESSQNELILHVYFIRFGAETSGDVRSDAKQPPKLSMDLPMQGFAFVPVSSPHETLIQLNEIAYGGNQPELKPWPGKLENVVIETDPTSP